MTSDLLFHLAVERLPKPLASAMIEHGLTNPAVLSYPRKSAEELGLVPVHEAKVRKVTGVWAAFLQQLFFMGLVFLLGLGRLLAVVVWQLQVWMWSLPGPRPVKVQNIVTGAVELVVNREMDDVPQLPHTTHPHDDITHPHPSLPRGYGKDCASALCGSYTHELVARRALKIGAVGSTVDTCSPSLLSLKIMQVSRLKALSRVVSELKVSVDSVVAANVAVRPTSTMSAYCGQSSIDCGEIAPPCTRCSAQRLW